MTEYIDPDRETFAALAKMDISGPVDMINLVAFRDQAAYDDGRAATGAAAYGEYSRLAAPFFAKADGKVVWSGQPKLTLIGPSDEKWDAAFIARYPTLGHFITMVTSPGYQAIVFHRTAALVTSRLICSKASDSAFG